MSKASIPSSPFLPTCQLYDIMMIVNVKNDLAFEIHHACKLIICVK
jgi:hypothetical protein